MSTTGYADPMTGQLPSEWPDIPEELEPVIRKPPGGEHVETAPAETEDAAWLVALDINGTRRVAPDSGASEEGPADHDE